jgi:hypothetical protein
MEPQWNADRQVNARNRIAREILRCKNHQIRLAPIEIVSIGREIAFVLAGAERHGSKYGFTRRAVLDAVLLDRAAFKVMLNRDIARRVAALLGPLRLVVTYTSPLPLVTLYDARSYICQINTLSS